MRDVKRNRCEQIITLLAESQGKLRESLYERPNRQVAAFDVRRVYRGYVAYVSYHTPIGSRNVWRTVAARLFVILERFDDLTVSGELSDCPDFA